MRKIWKMRKILIPQIVAALILFISVVLAPNTGAGNIAATKTHSTASTEGNIVTTTYETGTDDDTVVVKTHSTLLRKNSQTSRSASNADAQPKTIFDSIDGSVLAALGKMGLSVKNLEMWVQDHPDSTLRELGNMPIAKQRKVANVATFIRSINNKITPKIAWREASALVYYSAKYGVPTELSVGIAKTESRFNPSAMSHKGACGVMQVMWKVHYGMLNAKGIAKTKDHMFDPERGVEAGVLILSRYINAYGTVQKALNRYYGGISVSYLKKVNNNMAMLERHSVRTGF